jgi:uncharacterized protein YqjF (DUF2071 family)
MNIPFLTAEWRDLIVATYEVDPNLLLPRLPRGTDLDLFEDKAYVSIVAFRFLKMKLFGLIPAYPVRNFDEINLRFYIKCGEKRAVAFVKEVVPSRLIATTARLLYNEPYEFAQTANSKTVSTETVSIRYAWGKGLAHSIGVDALRQPQPLRPATLEEFILEHYWGYTAQRDGSTIEYQVTHPRWRYHPVTDYKLSESVKQYYGSEFMDALQAAPASVIVAEGSEVSVSVPRGLASV